MGVDAVKTGFPDRLSGGLGAEDGLVERLEANTYGKHAAWHGPVVEKAEGVELIPWVLFNRHLWESEAEMSDESNTVLLKICHATTADENHPQWHPGWFVEVETDPYDLSPRQITGFRCDDEAAPADEGFLDMPEGAIPPKPPVDTGQGKRRRLLFGGSSVALAALISYGAWLGVSGAAAGESLADRLTNEIAVGEMQKQQLVGQLQLSSARGLPASRAVVLLREIMILGAEMRIDGQTIRWRGAGAPKTLDCTAAEEGEGWFDCEWRFVNS